MRKRALFVGYLIMVCAITSTAYGQADPSAQLVGRWEGTQRQQGMRGSEHRTLIISSVTQREGRWVAEGRYGTKGGTKVQIEVDMTGQQPSLRWTTSSGNTVRVDLINPTWLSGTLTLVASGGDKRDRPITLEKVESK